MIGQWITNLFQPLSVLLFVILIPYLALGYFFWTALKSIWPRPVADSNETDYPMANTSTLLRPKWIFD
jgi:hypothetical protein